MQLFRRLLNVLNQRKGEIETEKIKIDYERSAQDIWKKYVPKSGQSKFVVGELLRAVEKLRDEANRNGNGNFNDQCHLILINFLRDKLSDKDVFEINVIEKINEELNLLSIEKEPQTGDEIYDRLTERVIDWSLFYGEHIIHKKNPNLLC